MELSEERIYEIWLKGWKSGRVFIADEYPEIFVREIFDEDKKEILKEEMRNIE